MGHDNYIAANISDHNNNILYFVLHLYFRILFSGSCQSAGSASQYLKKVYLAIAQC